MRPQVFQLEVGNNRCDVLSTGATVIAWEVGGKELIFSQRELEIGDQKKLRGGIPICSPWFGRAPAFWDGDPQHGFLRDLEIANDQTAADGDHVRFSLTTSANFHYRWSLEQKVTVGVGEKGLEVILGIGNRSEKPAPINPGFHPYFNAPKGGVIRVGNEEFLVSSSIETKILKLADPIIIDLIGIGTLRMSCRGFGERSVVVVWSDRSGYFCVEPVFYHHRLFGTGAESLISKGERQEFLMALHLE